MFLDYLILSDLLGCKLMVRAVRASTRKAIDTQGRHPYVPAPQNGGNNPGWQARGFHLAHGTRTFVANHKSALKRIRQSRKRQARNASVRSRMRTIVKKFKQAVAAGDSDAGEKLRAAEREIRKAATKGIIPARRASRTVSRLAKSLNGSQQASSS